MVITWWIVRHRAGSGCLTLLSQANVTQGPVTIKAMGHLGVKKTKIVQQTFLSKCMNQTLK